MNHDLILGGTSLKRRRQAVFHGLGETPLRLVTTQNRVIQEYLETSSKYCILVQCEALSRERTTILPNKVTCERPL